MRVEQHHVRREVEHQSEAALGVDCRPDDLDVRRADKCAPNSGEVEGVVVDEDDPDALSRHASRSRNREVGVHHGLSRSAADGEGASATKSR